jgi:ubiquinone/menaquinone biosynthesis C-methylase UbiE
MHVEPSLRPASERAFDAIASLYDTFFDTPLGRTVDALEKDLLYGLARPERGEQALDVGTGTGHFAADLVTRGLRVIGVDLSAPMLAQARRKGARAHWVRGDAARLPLASESYDLVLSVTALEFVAQAEAAIQEMWRMARPGGRLVIGALNARGLWAWARRRESRARETPFSHARFLSSNEFVGLLRQLGPVEWSSSVFVGPRGQGLGHAWVLERIGRRWFKPFGALLVGRVEK